MSNRHMRFLYAGGFTTTQDSMGHRPRWEQSLRDESQRLMDAADELAAQPHQSRVGQQLVRYAAEQIGYRGALKTTSGTRNGATSHLAM